MLINLEKLFWLKKLNFERVLGGPYMNRKFSAGQRRLPPAQAITTESYVGGKNAARGHHISQLNSTLFNLL